MTEVSLSELPLVTVCIPTYNRAERLQRAVESVLTCTYQNIEVLISDNGSTDNTRQVAEHLSNANPRIRYFRHPVNRGPTANFEFARAQATGTYFLWHGDDDYLACDFISTCVDELERDHSLVLASGLGAYHGGDGRVTGYGTVLEPTQRSALARALYYVWMVEDNSMFCGVYRRNEVAGCTMPNCLAGDWAWLGQVLLTGRAKVLTAVHVYRERGDNTSSSVRRIVSTLGLPPWHAACFWIVIPFNVAKHLASRRQNASLARRAAVFVSVLAVGLAKHALQMLLPKLPLGKSLYRHLFLRSS